MSQQPKVPLSRVAVHFLQMFAVKRIPLPTEKHTEAFKDGVCNLLPNNVDVYTQQGQSRLYVYGEQGENALLGLFLYEYVGIHLPLLAEQPKTNETYSTKGLPGTSGSRELGHRAWVPLPPKVLRQHRW